MKRVKPYLFEPTNEKTLEKKKKALEKKAVVCSKLRSPFFIKTVEKEKCLCQKCVGSVGGCCQFFSDHKKLTDAGICVGRSLREKFPNVSQSDNCITSHPEFSQFLSIQNVSTFSLGYLFQNNGCGISPFSNFSNRRKRFFAYAYFAASFYPTLNSNHSVVVPSCVAQFVRNIFPQEDISYSESSISLAILKLETNESDDDVDDVDGDDRV